ncbi:MAG: phosphoribosylformylglycinamidine synthase II, partial [Thermoplasmata archaeon]|nr:phosphoribosylformylglycinamidine synthase II [Thermoplasmata archaeon]
ASIPVVSGNVSLYNESELGAVPPTPTMMMIGLMDDVRKATTSDLKESGNIIYLMGRTRREMGGSAYYRSIDAGSDRVPDLDKQLMMDSMEAILEMNSDGLLASVHDLSEGGLAVALAEMCIGGGIGLDVNVRDVGSRDDRGEEMRVDTRAFSESNTRYVIEVEPREALRVEDCISRHEVPYTKLGTVLGESLRITSGEDLLVDIPVKVLDHAWRGGMKRMMEGSQ